MKRIADKVSNNEVYKERFDIEQVRGLGGWREREIEIQRQTDKDSDRDRERDREGGKESER